MVKLLVTCSLSLGKVSLTVSLKMHQSLLMISSYFREIKYNMNVLSQKAKCDQSDPGGHVSENPSPYIKGLKFLTGIQSNYPFTSQTPQNAKLAESEGYFIPLICNTTIRPSPTTPPPVPLPKHRFLASAEFLCFLFLPAGRGNSNQALLRQFLVFRVISAPTLVFGLTEGEVWFFL